MPERYEDGRWCLYHAVDDSVETQCLAGVEPALLDRLFTAWHQYAHEPSFIPGSH